MRANRKKATAPTPLALAQPDTQEWCLLGPRQLSSHLRFVEDLALAGGRPDLPEAAAAWRRAQDLYRQLEVAEAGAADDPRITALPASLSRHQARLEALPALRHTFNTVPVVFGMVELDKLVVSQYTITQAIVERLHLSFTAAPSPRQLAELCLPLVPGDSAFSLAYQDESEFVFVSDAHDMRYLAATLLDPANLAGLPVPGHPRAALALSVGFSSNVMNAVRLGNRVVLNNGHHRALALRAMGVRRVPCIIQVCGSDAELREAATAEIVDNSDLYFESPRPPLLRDYDHPGLVQRLRAPRLRRQVRLTVKVESRLMVV